MSRSHDHRADRRQVMTDTPLPTSCVLFSHSASRSRCPGHRVPRHAMRVDTMAKTAATLLGTSCAWRSSSAVPGANWMAADVAALRGRIIFSPCLAGSLRKGRETKREQLKPGERVQVLRYTLSQARLLAPRPGSSVRLAHLCNIPVTPTERTEYGPLNQKLSATPARTSAFRTARLATLFIGDGERFIILHAGL